MASGQFWVSVVLVWRLGRDQQREADDGVAGLTIFEGQISTVSYNLLMAGSLIVVEPVLVVALVVQRRVVEGLTQGAVR